MGMLPSPRSLALLWLVGASVAAALPASSVTMDEVKSQLTELRKQGRYEEALALARSTREKIAPDASLPPWERRDLEVRVSVLERILALAPDQRRQVHESDAIADEVNRAYGEGKYAEAVSAVRRQLAIRSRYLGETPDEALSLDDLGFLVASQGSLHEALDYQTRALSIRERAFGPLHPQTARSHSVVGNLLRRLFRFGAAEPHLSLALETRRKVFAQPSKSVAQSCNDLGTLYFHMSDYVKAERLLQEALTECASTDSCRPSDVGRAHGNLAYIMREQGRLFEAAQQCSLSLEAWAEVGPAGRSDSAAVLDLLGTVNYDLEQYDIAKELHSRALDILWRDQDANWDRTATCFNNLGNVYDALGKTEIADDQWKAAEAIVVLRRGEDHPELGKYLFNRANAARKLGRPQEAAQLCRRALRLWNKQKGSDHPDIVKAQWALAASLILQDSLAAADSILRKSEPAFESARGRMTAGPETSGALWSPYNLMACSLLLQNKTEQAWPLIAKIQGRGLADLLFLARGRRVDPRVIQRSDSLMRSIEALEGALRETARQGATGRTPAQRALVDSLRAELARLVDAHRALESSLSGAAAGFVADCELESVQGMLSPRSAMIGWLSVQLSRQVSRTWGYVIRHNSMSCIQLEEPSTIPDGLSVAAKARWLRRRLVETARIGSAGGPEYYAVDIFDAWVRPLMPYLDEVDHLIAVLPQPLLGLPLEVLQDEIGHYIMADRFTITYAPSPGIALWLHESQLRARPATMRALLVGDPPFSLQQARETQAEGARGFYPCDLGSRGGVREDARPSPVSLELAFPFPRDLRRLPGTRWVVQQVRDLFRDPVVLLGLDASTRQLQRLHRAGELRTFDVIHFGTHLWPDETWPQRSALVFSQVDSLPAMDDGLASVEWQRGRLTAEEIVRGWDLSADLVTISTCQSALGLEVYGEGYVGLATAFMQAGARSVLASLWDVTDCETALLLEQFYRELNTIRQSGAGDTDGGSFSKARALREARRTLRERAARDPSIHGHPAYWAAFVLLGEP